MAATTPEELLPSLKKELQNDCIVSKDYNLVKFLNWKSNVKRAAGRYRGLQTWKSQNEFAFTNLLASQDESLKCVLESEVLVAPEGMVDKQGRTVLVGRLRNNDMSDGRTPRDVVRMFIYTIDRVLENPAAQQNGIVVFHDLTGLSPGNLDIRIPKMLFGAIIGHFPIRVKGVYVYNAPGFFRVLFSVASPLIIPAKIRQRVHFVDSMNEVYEVIDQEEMLEEHGGKRVHDTRVWVAKQMQREENGTLESLGDCTVVSST
jgi:hypothetical protein